MNYTRQPDLTWSITGSRFGGPQTSVRSFIPDWEANLNVQGTAAGIAEFMLRNMTTCDYQKPDLDNIGCATASNNSIPVDNFVYASGEAIRILYNVAATNSAAARPEYFYNVTGTSNQQFYCITYIPVLLLIGLLCIILCSSLTALLVISTMSTFSWKIFREVDLVRVVADVAAGDLHEDADEMVKLGLMSDAEVDKWARKNYVAYSKSSEINYGQEIVTVRLRVTDGRGNKDLVKRMAIDDLLIQPRDNTE